MIDHQTSARAAAASGNMTTLGVADWLSLAAAPTFAMMVLFTLVFGSSRPDALCSTHDALSLGGMVPMYVLMSAFHSAPWLKLISNRRNGSRKPCSNDATTPLSRCHGT
jgi:hypothetical protein